jgi:hypothetical protein
MEEMPKKVRTGRLDAQTVQKREKWVLDWFKKQFAKKVDPTKDDLNQALMQQKDLGAMPMRPVRVYEIKRAAKAGAAEVPPVTAGKRPSKRAASAQGGGPAVAPSTAARVGRAPTEGQERQAVEAATKLLHSAGLEEVQISYRPSRRVVTAG